MHSVDFPKRILVTGGAGYIGSACLRWLLKHGHDAIAYDDLSEGNASAVPSGRLVVGSLLDRDCLTQAMREHAVGSVMHFAAVASVPDSISEPERYYRINVLGTKNVLDSMRDSGIESIVFSSTAATYALTEDMPLREDSPQIPQVPYGTTKLACEWMIKEYSRAYGIGYAIFRYFNASGADCDGCHGESRRKESHLIPLVLAVAAGTRETILVHGSDYPTPDGTCIRDYVHVEDLAEAHRLALLATNAGDREVFNVGSGTGHSVKEVIQACEDVVGKPIQHQVVARRAGDPARLIASPRKLVEKLGWKPRFTNLRDIVATAWKWHKSHPRGYADQQLSVASR
jgi:UDP-glucose 4-epimerase